MDRAAVGFRHAPGGPLEGPRRRSRLCNRSPAKCSMRRSHFKGQNQPYWLPIMAKIEVQTRHQHWRNTHQFSKHRLFNVDAEAAVGTAPVNQPRIPRNNPMTSSPAFHPPPAGNSPRPKAASPDRPHHIRLGLAWVVSVTLIATLGVYGFSYYTLSLEDRPLSPLHYALRPSGTIGLRLGMLGFGLFCVLFLYPMRKHVKWLASIGKTRHWLDFHVLVGISAPIVITYHASFKLAGLAGIAYWIMIAVALSGFAGRYIYAQIPRSLNTAQLSLGELQTQSNELACANRTAEYLSHRRSGAAPAGSLGRPKSARCPSRPCCGPCSRWICAALFWSAASAAAC